MDQHMISSFTMEAQAVASPGSGWPSPNVAWAGVVSVPWAKVVGICEHFSQCQCNANGKHFIYIYIYIMAEFKSSSKAGTAPSWRTAC